MLYEEMYLTDYSHSSSIILSDTNAPRATRVSILSGELLDFIKAIDNGDRNALSNQLSGIRQRFNAPLKSNGIVDTHVFSVAPFEDPNQKLEKRRQQNLRTMKYAQALHPGEQSPLSRKMYNLLDTSSPNNMKDLTEKAWKDADALVWVAENTDAGKPFTPQQKNSIMNRLARITVSNAIHQGEKLKDNATMKKQRETGQAMRSLYEEKPLAFIQKLADSKQFKKIVGTLDTPADLKKFMENGFSQAGRQLIGLTTEKAPAQAQAQKAIAAPGMNPMEKKN